MGTFLSLSYGADTDRASSSSSSNSNSRSDSDTSPTRTSQQSTSTSDTRSSTGPTSTNRSSMDDTTTRDSSSSTRSSDSYSRALSPTDSSEGDSSSSSDSFSDNSSSSNANESSSSSGSDDSLTSSDTQGPTSTQAGGANSSRDSSSAGPTPTSTSNGSDDNQSSSSDSSESSSSSNDSNSSSSSSDNQESSTSAGGGAASTSSSNENSDTNSSSQTSSSNANAGPTSTSTSSSSTSSSSSSSNTSSSSTSSSSSSSDSQRSLSTSTSYDVFVTTINGHAVTSTHISIHTSTPKPGELSSNDNGYWDDSGAVGGTFAAVGIVAVALLAALGWFLYRRRKAKRMDADVLAAASAAAATTRTPFDDDDDDMGHTGPYTTGPENVGATHPYYNPEYPVSPGFHQPGHYAHISEDPFMSPMGPESAMSPANNSGVTTPGHPTSAAFQYYTPQRSQGSSDLARGTYESVPTDNVYAYNSMPYDVASLPPVVSSAAAYNQAPLDPHPYDAYAAQGMSAPSMASGHTSQSADYEPAQSHQSHFEVPVSYASGPPLHNFQAYNGHGAVPSNQGHAMTSSSMGVPSSIYHAYQGPATESVTSEDEHARPAPPVTTGGLPPVTAGGLPPVPVTATDEAPPYVPGTQAPVVSDEKRPVQEPNRQPSISHMAPEGVPSVTQAFGADTEGQSALDHGDWDPPALSSAWFPTSEPPHEPTETESVRMSGAPLQGEAVNTDSVHTNVEGESAIVEDVPARLVVRNPSPEEE